MEAMERERDEKAEGTMPICLESRHAPPRITTTKNRFDCFSDVIPMDGDHDCFSIKKRFVV